MQTRPLHRAVALCLSLAVTLTMLASVRGLSAHEEASARFAMSMCAVARV